LRDWPGLRYSHATIAQRHGTQVSSYEVGLGYPRYVGRHLTLKADASSVTIYDQYQEITSYARCWQRGQVLGAEVLHRIDRFPHA
jgi:hypothetical protein